MAIDVAALQISEPLPHRKSKHATKNIITVTIA